MVRNAKILYQKTFAFFEISYFCDKFGPLKDPETCRQKEAKQISEVLTDFLQIKIRENVKKNLTTLITASSR